MEFLSKLLQGFDDRPAESGRLMRELLEADQQGFLTAAMTSLAGIAASRGLRYLVALLADNDLLSTCICEPALNVPEALALARTGIQIDRALDIKLVRRLIEVLKGSGKRGEDQALRTLEILGEISDGPRLLPLLTNVLHHPNARVRSKVALLMSRRNRNSHWVGQRQQEADPRVRANALEGLWEVDNDGARAVLWEASQDTNNRVVGNALLGLYSLGETHVIERILAMAEDSLALELSGKGTEASSAMATRPAYTRSSSPTPWK